MQMPYSRLPLPDMPEAVPALGDVNLLIEHLAESIITSTHIKSWTEKNRVLARVHHFILHGWPVSNTAFTLANIVWTKLIPHQI